MLQFVGGFEEPCSPPSPIIAARHRRPLRQRSLLTVSLSVHSAASSPGMSRMGSCETMESSDALEGLTPGSLDEVDGPTQTAQSPGGVNIPYTRVARERIDRAEAQGRRRDEQLEMLHAVRQYMAAGRAHHQQPQGSSCSARAHLPHQQC